MSLNQGRQAAFTISNTNMFPSRKYLQLDTYRHYLCSYENIKPILEKTTTVITLALFTFLSCHPSLALAYNQTVDPIAQRLAFTVPYGPVRSLVIDGRVVEPSDLTFKPGMHISVWASAYSSSVEETDGNPFMTASGITVNSKTMASNFLPLGTVVSLNGKEYIVQDRMNSRYNNEYTVDVWQPSSEAAFAFGMRLVTIEILSLP